MRRRKREKEEEERKGRKRIPMTNSAGLEENLGSMVFNNSGTFSGGCWRSASMQRRVSP